MVDQEIDAMAKVSSALAAVDDPQARIRVLRWANEKFGFASPSGTLAAKAKGISDQNSETDKEISGVAVLNEKGEVRFTIRDLKAKSAREATMRLVYVSIQATQALTGKRSVSRKGVIVPLLKHWRIYDGNARRFLATDRGLLKNGNELELDGQAQKDAAQYIAEIQNSTLIGSWKPGNNPRKRAAPKVAPEKK